MSGWQSDPYKQIDKLRRFDRAVSGSLQDVTEAGAEQTTRLFKRRVPQRTRRLFNSLTFNKGDLSPSESTHEIRALFYWRFLEYGTKKMSKRPFIRPAIDHNKNRVLNTMKKVVTRTSEGIF